MESKLTASNSATLKQSRKSVDGDLDKFLSSQFEDLDSHLLGAHAEEEENVYLNSVVDYQKATAHSHSTVRPDIIKILIVYTGGTIGMKAIEGQGYTPVTNWFYDSLSRISRFNDLEFCKLMDTASSFKSSKYQNGQLVGVETHIQPALITPCSLYGKRIKYNILEYDPLLDSANMNMFDWVKIATDIEHNYDAFDAFVVVHGTDTMAYTASALSFMLEDLTKTVVITGSQVPLAEWRTDAEENLLCSLLMASHFLIPEVCLFFGNKLFRGNRTTKINALDFVAFDSPNLKPLADTGVNISINWNEIRSSNKKGRFNAHKDMNSNVATLRIFPGITSSTVEAFLSHPIQGVVLETYGAGNVPTTRNDILKLINEACQKGVVIVNCTQCKRGYVSDLYATGKALTALGVVPGGDMTPECALTKLSYLLGKNRSPKEVRILMQKNLRGELSDLTTFKPLEHVQFISHEEYLPSSSPPTTLQLDKTIEDLQNALMPIFLEITPPEESGIKKCKAVMRVILPGDRFRKGVVTSGKSFEEAKEAAARILFKEVTESLTSGGSSPKKR